MLSPLLGRQTAFVMLFWDRCFSSIRKLLCPLLSLLAIGAATAESFEAPDYTVGNALPAAWQKEEIAEISADESVSGAQSLKIGPESTVRYGQAKNEGIIYADLQILPVAGKNEVLNLGGARLGFGADGKISIFEGDGAEGRPSRVATYGVDSGIGTAWVRLTVRVDTGKKKWDLYVDGRPAEADLALGNATAALTVFGPSVGSVYLDDYVQAEENPLFPDADKDGMADAEEKANGLNPYGDDRDGDLDGDGISNVDEMFAGSSPQAPGPLGGQAARLFYVDNLNGNDSNSGRHSYVGMGQDGPKASLKAAMAAAPPDGIIVVLKGKGIYEEGSRGTPDKQLTIKSVDPVTIR